MRVPHLAVLVCLAGAVALIPACRRPPAPPLPIPPPPLAAEKEDYTPAPVPDAPSATPAPRLIESRVILRTEDPLPPFDAVTIPAPNPPPLAPMPMIPELPEPPSEILVTLPDPDILTAAGRKLLHDFEVGGGKAYYEKYLARPTWPEAASGVTIGIGYDLRFNSREVFRADWHQLPARDLDRLVSAQGLSGAAAKQRARELRDIVIPWEIASEVFERTTVVKFDQLCRRTWPGYDALRGHAQDSLLSLTFNRGSSMTGPKRRHMRAIRARTPRADYAGIAAQQRAMVVIWQGTSIEAGMRRRRNAEAALTERL